MTVGLIMKTLVVETCSGDVISERGKQVYTETHKHTQQAKKGTKKQNSSVVLVGA